MSNQIQPVPFELGFRGEIDPGRVPELIDTVARLATSLHVSLQFGETPPAPEPGASLPPYNPAYVNMVEITAEDGPRSVPIVNRSSLDLFARQRFGDKYDRIKGTASRSWKYAIDRQLTPVNTNGGTLGYRFTDVESVVAQLVSKERSITNLGVISIALLSAFVEACQPVEIT